MVFSTFFLTEVECFHLGDFHQFTYFYVMFFFAYKIPASRPNDIFEMPWFRRLLNQLLAVSSILVMLSCVNVRAVGLLPAVR